MWWWQETFRLCLSSNFFPNTKYYTITTTTNTTIILNCNIFAIASSIMPVLEFDPMSIYSVFKSQPSWWKWRHHGPPKCWYPATSLHCLLTQKTTWTFKTAISLLLDYTFTVPKCHISNARFAGLERSICNSKAGFELYLEFLVCTISTEAFCCPFTYFLYFITNVHIKQLLDGCAVWHQTSCLPIHNILPHIQTTNYVAHSHVVIKWLPWFTNLAWPLAVLVYYW